MAKTTETPITLLPSNGEPEPDQAGEENQSTRRMDHELRIMGTMLRLLDELDEPARGRVVRWLQDRYQERCP